MITPNNRYWGLYIIIFVIFCDFGFYKTFKDETEKLCNILMRMYL